MDVRLSHCTFMHADEPNVIENVKGLVLEDVRLNGQAARPEDAYCASSKDPFSLMSRDDDPTCTSNAPGSATQLFLAGSK